MLRRALFASLVPVIALVVSCMGATEIVVHISTNACQSLLHTEIWVDGKHVTQAPTPQCDANPFAVVDVGTITLLPSHGIDSDVKITIVGNVSTDTNACAAADPTEQQCIVARRALAFNPHQRLDLPILLDNACAGFPCPADQTCEVDQNGPHCGNSTCGKGDAPSCSTDAGGADVIVSDVIAIDSGPLACLPIVPAASGTPTFSWKFDNAPNDGKLHEDKDAFTPPLNGAAVVSSPPTFCDNPYLQSKSGQLLASSGNIAFQNFVTKSFIAGLAFDTAVTDADLLSLVGSSTQNAGFDIAIASSAVHVSFGGQLVYTAPPITTAGWHRFAIEVTTITSGTGTDQSTITPYIDGAPAGLVSPAGAYAPGSPLSFSIGSSIAVDNVVFYMK